MSIDEIVKVLEFGKDIVLGAFGGLVAYLFDYKKANEKSDGKAVFKFSLLLTNITLGMFVAYSVGTLIPETTEGRTILIAGSGVFAFGILLLAESKLASYIFEIGERFFGKRIEKIEEKDKNDLQ